MRKKKALISLLAFSLLVAGCTAGAAELASSPEPAPPGGEIATPPVGQGQPVGGGAATPQVGQGQPGRGADTPVSAVAPVARLEGPLSLLSDNDKRRLALAGLSEEALVASLVEQTDLLPVKGTLGGTARFEPSSQWVITPTWVLAHWSDGHTGGYVVARYQLTDGELRWLAVDAGPDYLADPTELAQQLEARAEAVLKAFATKDGQALAGLVHTKKGVRFTPYGYVDSGDVTLPSDAFAHAFENDFAFHWGYFDGSGFPIELTIAEYVERFVVPVDYFAPEVKVGYHQVIGTGNSLNNIYEAYPGGVFIEYHHPGTEQYDGMDWHSLRLVFEPGLDGEWALIAVISDQWTI